MPEHLGRSAQADRKTRVSIAAWPRLMSLEIVAAYSSLSVSTWRDYVADHLIRPVEMPGSTLRDKAGQVIAHARDRRIAKILLDRQDVDRFIERMKAEGAGRD